MHKQETSVMFIFAKLLSKLQITLLSMKYIFFAILGLLTE